MTERQNKLIRIFKKHFQDKFFKIPDYQPGYAWTKIG
jgi:uncharacterized protein with ParB-like and HNH nuclease domain